MSNKIQEKQPQKDNKRELDADDIFNQQLFKTLAYAGAGFGAGIVASVFLKHRKALSLIGAGTGAAYGYNNFQSELNNFNKFKDYANQAKTDNTLKRDDQLATKNWDQFMPKEQNLSQQKRYGGSDDDSDSKNKERKQSQEPKSRDSKGGEQKGHEATESRPKTQSKSPSESQHTSGGKGKEEQKPSQMHKKETDLKDSDKQGGQKSKSSAPSEKESDKSSQLKNVNKGQEQQKPSQMHKKESDLKDSDRQAGNKIPQKSAPSPKESDKNVQQQQQQQKGESQKKESQGKEDSQKKENQDKENKRSFFQWGRNVKGESNLTAGSESKSPNLGAQHLQDFKTNPGPGKPAPGEDALHRGAERDSRGQGKHEVSESNQQSRMVKQDPNYRSTRTGNKMKVEPNPENIAGSQFSERGLTAKDQVNAVIE